ncbi:non-ribosomal peptide synthetase [Nostoc sp. MG11]|uniref:non-ribosomal peptide synthetase n=1 Tax=Nostoc sp. MG11 TaxID=2721166 RepID=UPI0018676EB6|nr:non-ribosomal peptide synthetase [Nostoc sp. MG11]
MIEGFELSPQQKHLWKLQYSSPNFPYRAQCAVQIKGKIEPNTLKSAIKQVISSHEILRTTFSPVPGMTLPLQVIASDFSLHFSEYDYTEIELESQLTQIELLWKRYSQLPFDFSQNSLFHCTLVTLSEEESVLLLNLPTLYVDIKGLDNLVLKISNSYRACTKSEELFEDVLQYADISEWQNQLLDDEEQELIFAKSYWRKQNITDSLSIKLPFERQSAWETEFEPRYLKFIIPSRQVEQISEFIEKEKVPIDLFFLACWQIFLWLITQESEVFVGVGCEGREYEVLQDSIGLLAKYLPLKSSFKKGLLFLDVLKQIQLEINSIYSWQKQFNWESIIDEKKSYIDTAFIPFGFDFTQTERHIVDDICFSIIKQDVCFDKFKIKLSFTHNHCDLVAKLCYDARLFEEDYIQCLAEQFQMLLSSILDCPETAIDKIEILSDVEREKILHQFNDTSCDYPKDKCIHQLFEEQVEKTPDAIALVFEEQQLTYKQLNQRANQLADHLQKLGVKPEVLVGICVERSIEMVVGLLAILKAGGAYVPFDPKYPQERLSYMLNDSAVEVLLTQRSLVEESLPPNPARVVCLDTGWGVIEQQYRDNFNSGVKLNNLAYVIYTSGSTGQPKGVAIAHKSIFNYVYSLIQIINIKPSSNFALVSTISTDLGNTVIFPCLLTGGCLHVISEEKVSDPKAIREYFNYQDIDYLKIVPSHLAALQISLDPALVLPIKTLILGGEASSSDWVETIQAQSPNSNIINHYGPTETTVGVLTYFLDQKSLPLRSSTLPIGRPIANTQIYILDEDLQPVPIGMPGELYIGGDGLARSYLNNPQLTSEKFIPNPFDKSKQKPTPVFDDFISKDARESLPKESKLYKTGDLARYLPDGNIEFIGRIDHQVKIRGFRIELGEIESVLNGHPQIQQAVVIAIEESSGNKRLVAYIVFYESFPTKEIREFLLSKLPEYMVPSAFVILDTLPLTPNGKLDKKALPSPDSVSRENEYVAPRTQNEELIASIFSEILSVQSVGIHDNFFTLGGHSLFATQVISRLNQTFSVELSLRQIFEIPTVAELAEAVTQLQHTEDEDMAHLLAELEDLSDDKVQQLLAEEMHSSVHS